MMAQGKKSRDWAFFLRFLSGQYRSTYFHPKKYAAIPSRSMRVFTSSSFACEECPPPLLPWAKPYEKAARSYGNNGACERTYHNGTSYSSAINSCSAQYLRQSNKTVISCPK
jgi:hypothetical protein